MSRLNLDAWNYRGSYFGCWNWTGYLFNRGVKGREYGGVWINGKKRLVHRVAWEALNGAIPDGFELCHSCDNPSCWRPDHLFLGSHQENLVDAAKKGRLAVKLSEHEVNAVKTAVASGESMRSVARRYHVSHQLISMIVGGKRRTLLLTGGEFHRD
jgi:HNH endonuclease